jgi:group I intron endonuclease
MVIYKTTNLINGKFYIGKDKHNNPKYFGSGKVLKQAIKKYGIENFAKEIIEECDDEKYWLEREIYWIQFYDSINNGYNIALGGNGGDTISNNSNKKEIYEKKKKTYNEKSEKLKKYRREKISNSMKKRWIELKETNPNFITERNEKISKAQKGVPKPIEQINKQKETKKIRGTSVGENNPMFGKTHNIETKRKLSELKIGKKRSEESIKNQKLSIKKREIITCPHCGLSAKKSANMTRYHFDYCKNIKSYE